MQESGVISVQDYYLKQTFPYEKFTTEMKGSRNSKTVYQLLSSVFSPYGWTYAIRELKFGKNSTAVSVTVYLPGIIRDGFAMGKTPQGGIDLAIWNALDTLNFPYSEAQPKTTPAITVRTAPSPNAVVESKQSIAATTYLQNAPTKEVVTPPVSVPQEGNQALDKDNAINALSEMFGISKKNAEDFYNVRKKYGIKTKQQLLKYLQNWDSKIKAISELNTSNIDNFIEWANNYKPEGFSVIGGATV